MKRSIYIICLFFLQFSNGQPILTETQKLVSTCKIWGFLKYYHPNVASGKYDWDEQLFDVLNKVDAAKTKKELSLVYENWINSLGEVKKNGVAIENINVKYFYKNLDLNWIEETTFFSKEVSAKLLFIKNNRWQGNQYYVTVDFEDGFAFPVKIQNENRLRNLKWSDLNFRMVTLFRFWNIMNYFYPYKYLMDQNWNSALIKFLPKFINVKTEKDFHTTILEIAASLNDTHVSYFPEYDGMPKLGSYFLPANYKFIDNKMVITKILNDSMAKRNNIKLGDAITRIDNRYIIDFINENRTTISASNNAAYLKELRFKISPFLKDTIKVEFLRDSKKFSQTIRLYDWHDFNRDRNLKKTGKYEFLENNIGYINLVRIKNTDLESIFSTLKNTQAIIIDLRDYPTISENDLLPYFERKNKVFVKQTYADLKYPGRFVFEENFGGSPAFESNSKYTGKVILLVDEATHSHAEWLAMCFKTVKSATIIGSQTSGADGGVSSYEITNPFKISFTGKGVYYPNGQETQRVGIVPDIIISPTIKGITDGKDEVIERAIKFIKTDK